MTTYEVFVGGSTLISGPFSVVVVKDDGTQRKIVSTVSGIQDIHAANARALEYQASFGASLPWGLAD